MFETYGRINLSIFFLNHLKMTISFLQHLETREDRVYQEDEYKIKNRTIINDSIVNIYNHEMKNGFKSGIKKLFVRKK
jgi:hypothetical protein